MSYEALLAPERCEHCRCLLYDGHECLFAPSEEAEDRDKAHDDAIDEQIAELQDDIDALEEDIAGIEDKIRQLERKKRRR